MKTRSLVLLFILVFLLGILSAGLVYFFNTQPRNETVSVLQRLEAVYQKDTLNTAEAVSQFLFPYDFFPTNTDFRRFRAIGSVEASRLTTDERELLSLVLLAQKLGINSLKTRQFLVLTARASAGWDFSVTPLRVESDPAGEKTTIVLPPITVNEFRILDNPAEGFPELPLGASLWREVVLTLKPFIQKRMSEIGLLETAKANAETQIRNLVESLGFDLEKVVFIFGE